MYSYLHSSIRAFLILPGLSSLTYMDLFEGFMPPPRTLSISLDGGNSAGSPFSPALMGPVDSVSRAIQIGRPKNFQVTWWCLCRILRRVRT